MILSTEPYKKKIVIFSLFLIIYVSVNYYIFIPYYILYNKFRHVQ